MSSSPPLTLDEAISQALAQHTYRDRSGQCECGEFATGFKWDRRDPNRQIADHLTKHIAAAVRRYLDLRETK